MKILPKRGMPKPFSGIRASGRGKGHRRPWTLISSSSFLCIIFLVSNGQKTMAKPMKIIRLGADQIQEMLKYIHAAENGNKNANKDQNGIEEKEEEMSILFELKANKEGKSKIVAMEREEECRQMEDGEEQNSLKLRIRHFLHSQLQHVWSDQFEVKVLGMNVSIHSIRTRHIRPPHLQIDAICSTKDGSNRLIASLSGGSLTLLANYRSKYRTIREGTVHIRLGQFHGKLATQGRNECSQVGIDHLTVQFGPKLLEDVNETVAMHLRERVKHLICNRLQQFLSQNYPLTTKR